MANDGVYTRMGNGPVELPTGLIALHAYPAGQDPIGQGGAFKAHCYSLGTDPDTVFFLTLPGELKYVFHGKIGRDTRIPLVVRERTHDRLPYHKATLLVPPGTTKRSRFFDRCMVVPDLVVDHPLGNERSPRGYVMTSEHCPRQEFFAAAREMPPVSDPSSLSGSVFQAMISDPHKDDVRRRPLVRPILDYRVNPHVFSRNAEAMEDLRTTPATDFWWDCVRPGADHAWAKGSGDDDPDQFLQYL